MNRYPSFFPCSSLVGLGLLVTVGIGASSQRVALARAEARNVSVLAALSDAVTQDVESVSGVEAQGANEAGANEETANEGAEPAAKDLSPSVPPAVDDSEVKKDASVEASDSGNQGSKKTVVIELEGPIDWARFTHFRNKLQQAERLGAELVVLVINSPGGLLEESLEMGKMLAEVDWAQTVVYVPEKALSGAAILSLGAHRIVIGPRARFGDAGVISLDDHFMWQYAEEKILSDIVRRIRDLAAMRGYPPELAEAMIDRRAVVFYRERSSGGLEYKIVYATDELVAPEAPAVADGEPKWNRIEETLGNRFLEVNSSTAQRIGLAAPAADSLDELLVREGASRPAITLRRTTSDAVAYLLTRPLMRVLLILIALVALYFELSAPGISVGGLIAAIAFGALFWSSFMSGLAGALEILLFLGAFICIAMEIFVIPGFGVAGVLGALMLIASLVLMGQATVMPESQLEWNELMNSLGVVTGSSLAFFAIAGVISRYMGSVPVLNRMMLPPPEEALHPLVHEEQKKAFKTHAQVKVGDWGEAQTPLRPAGKAHFGDAMIDVVSEGSFIEAGSVIRVVEIQGNRIVVMADEAKPEGN